MMRVEQHCERLSAPAVLTAILNEFSAVTDYRTMRDSLPRRLAHLLKCRCVLLYQRIGETLQFASGTFDEKPGWSASLLAVAHINPIELNSDTLEAHAWRLRHAVTFPAQSATPTHVAVPLIYRQRAVGVLVAIRGGEASYGSSSSRDVVEHAGFQASDRTNSPELWIDEEAQVVEVTAGVVAMLLENARLLERDRERIHELSLLNSISSQIHCSIHEWERVRSVVIQRTKEIANVDLCELLLPSTPPDTIMWMTPALQKLLLHRVDGQAEIGSSPLIIERPGDIDSSEYLGQLAANIKTFFAIPLVSSHGGGSVSRGGWGGRRSGLVARGRESETKVLGVIVGAYHRPWKLRREELVLLQVLANQASAALENISLMADVVEARNEARKLLRQVLEDQRLKELIMESIPSGLITVDLTGSITTFNRAAEGILGYHPYEVLEQPLQKILNIDPLYKLTQVGQAQSKTLTTLDRQGREVVLDVTLLPLRDDHGKQVGVLITFIDVTSVHQLEEEKRRLDRLASLGEMAASVAHEVRNPLASIKTSVQMLLYDLTGDDEAEDELHGAGHNGSSCINEGAQESVSVVLKEVERLDSIVRDLLLFAKPRQLHIVECNLVELSDRVLQFLQAQFTEAGVVVHRVYHAVPLVRVDVSQMEQVLFNLYMNALQAMPDGGVLSVSCEVVHTGTTSSESGGSFGERREIGNLLELNASRHGYDEQQDWLELSVSDTGVGISADALERIFQPFFTTKAHGIGLGLPITRRLVEDHHGYLLVESQLGYGATISVRLPLMGECPQDRQQALSLQDDTSRERGGIG